ncbi:MAG: DUF1893 domain-containing protein [Hydrogenoanaerobacterium sp.]
MKASSLAKEKLHLPVSCVILCENGNELVMQGRGIKPLLDIYNKKPEALKNAAVADKIIGKAAAAILILGGVSYIYADVMSKAAAAFLEQYGILAEHGALVSEIRNREDTDSCPMEKLAAQHKTPAAIYNALSAFFAQLQSESRQD